MAGPSPILYLLRACKHDGTVLASVPSIHEEKGARRVALSILNLLPSADFVDMRPYINGAPSVGSSTLVFREESRKT